MTKSLTRLVSTVTLISALGLGAAFAQTSAPTTGNAAATPAITAPANGKAVDAKAKPAGHQTSKDHVAKDQAAKDQAPAKTHAVKPDAAKTEKKAAVDAPQTTVKTEVKAGSANPTVTPKS